MNLTMLQASHNFPQAQMILCWILQAESMLYMYNNIYNRSSLIKPYTHSMTCTHALANSLTSGLISNVRIVCPYPKSYGNELKPSDHADLQS